MIVKFNLTLSNPTTENWQVWKGLEDEIREIITQEECVELSREYDDVNFEKKVTLQYESDKHLCRVIVKVTNFTRLNGLEVDMTDRVKVSSPSLDLNQNHKLKYKKEVA